MKVFDGENNQSKRKIQENLKEENIVYQTKIQILALKQTFLLGVVFFAVCKETKSGLFSWTRFFLVRRKQT